MSINTRNYGDLSRITTDIELLNDIINRQGTNLIIDVIAEYVGQQQLQWNFSHDEIKLLIESLTDDLKESILERV
jgi:hypothetical protein